MVWGEAPESCRRTTTLTLGTRITAVHSSSHLTTWSTRASLAGAEALSCTPIVPAPGWAHVVVQRRVPGSFQVCENDGYLTHCGSAAGACGGPRRPAQTYLGGGPPRSGPRQRQALVMPNLK
jgi:hypothetical protein